MKYWLHEESKLNKKNKNQEVSGKWRKKYAKMRNQQFHGKTKERSVEKPQKYYIVKPYLNLYRGSEGEHRLQKSSAVVRFTMTCGDRSSVWVMGAGGGGR